MNLKLAVQATFLMTCVAWANLCAADRVVAAASRHGGSSTSPPDHSTALGDEDDPSRPVGIAATTWHENFNARLDESLARLLDDAGKLKSEAVEVTWSERSGNPSVAPFATTSGMLEGEGQAAMIARLLQEQGLPPGLTSVVAVESAFNPLALSPKGARGLWQLMPATARRYGLKVERNDDERTNPLKSTRAAAAYMKDLFAQFQDWPLALAAYNAGEDRVARAMTRTGARDFWTLMRRGALPEETLQYVPAVLEKFEGPLDAPETEPSISPAVPGQYESPAGRIAYATPAVDKN